MNKQTSVCTAINSICGVNIYENKRTQNLVDIRSMACYILHKDLKFTLHKIKDHFISNGKEMNHSTVLHNVRLFDVVRARKPHLNEIRDTIMAAVDPKYLLLKRIENIEDKDAIERITNCINYNE